MPKKIEVSGKPRLLLRYLIAVVASCVALALISILNPITGFTPILLLAAVVVVQRFAGAGPSILSIILCTLVSVRFLDAPYADLRAHKLSELIILPVVAGGLVYLLETRRKQRRVAHEQSLELSTLLNSMIEGVFVFDKQGNIVEVNRAGEILAGRHRVQLLGTHYTEVAKMMNVQQEGSAVPLSGMGVARALRGEVVQNESRSYTRPQDHHTMHATISVSPMRVGRNRRVLGAVLIMHDVTELAHLQRRIADSERHYAIGQMASGLAHDFNNVLNTITQSTALMQLNPQQSEDDRRVYLRMIDRAARTGAEIIKRVREYVRGGAGEAVAVDLAFLMQESLDLAESMLRAHENISVEARINPVPPVWANASDLRRVLTNLIVNAIQAMPDGGVLTVETNEKNGSVYALVSDTGKGIPVDVQKSLFTPYFTTKAAGTGLGLFMAQKILLGFGGDISFSSEPGAGTTFTIEIPAMQTETAKTA